MVNRQSVYGERVSDLLPAPLAFRNTIHQGRDGFWRTSLKLESAVAAPLQKALLRAEAEVLLEEADLASPQQLEVQTARGLRADAFVRIVQAVGRADGHGRQ